MLWEDEAQPLSEVLSTGVKNYSNTMGIRVVTLPPPFNNFTFLVALPFGVADVHHKMMRFFVKKTNFILPNISGGAKQFCSENAIMKALIAGNSVTSAKEKIFFTSARPALAWGRTL